MYLKIHFADINKEKKHLNISFKDTSDGNINFYPQNKKKHL